MSTNPRVTRIIKSPYFFLIENSNGSKNRSIRREIEIKKTRVITTIEINDHKKNSSAWVFTTPKGLGDSVATMEETSSGLSTYTSCAPTRIGAQRSDMVKKSAKKNLMDILYREIRK
jgi:hypothetical protein